MDTRESAVLQTLIDREIQANRKWRNTSCMDKRVSNWRERLKAQSTEPSSLNDFFIIDSAFLCKHFLPSVYFFPKSQQGLCGASSGFELLTASPGSKKMVSLATGIMWNLCVLLHPPSDSYSLKPFAHRQQWGIGTLMSDSHLSS